MPRPYDLESKLKFFSGLIIGLLIAAAIPAFLIYTGSYNMTATRPASMMEKRAGKMSWENWVHKTAPAAKNPYANDASVLESGLDHYKENCIVCHSAPGMEFSEIAKGMNPGPPILEHVDDFTDGELFYIIKNGIRMTGMPAFGPTHSDDEIWKIAAFIRHLPKLTDQEKAALKSASSEEEEHHHHD